MDEQEVKQVPSNIVKAFVDRYGKIGQLLDESDWLDLFGAWYAGWMASEKYILARLDQASVHPDFRKYATGNILEEKECSTDTAP